jgi:predicted  nucleic acid-binding Zn-ribbon protein
MARRPLVTDNEPIFDELRDHELLPAWAHRIAQQLAHLTKEIAAMSQDQSHLDADVQALTDAEAALVTEIDALKNQPGAAALDFSKLDAIKDKLTGDAAPTPPAPAA